MLSMAKVKDGIGVAGAAEGGEQGGVRALLA